MLKDGLKVFEFYHDFKLHSDEKIKPFITFMTLFSHIQDKDNFRDVIESNIELIFKYLLKYSRDCFNICLYNFLINPFYLNSSHPTPMHG